MNSPTVQNINVGVDTGKSQLDIYIRPLDIYFSVSNDEKGIQEAVKSIKKHKPERVVIEATGRLELAFVIASAKAKLPLVNERKPTSSTRSSLRTTRKLSSQSYRP